MLEEMDNVALLARIAKTITNPLTQGWYVDLLKKGDPSKDGEILALFAELLDDTKV